jgi:hypothetical protein
MRIPDASTRADRLEHDIEGIRDELGNLVDELDDRRRAAFDIRLQLQRHPIRIVMVAAALTGVVVGGLALRRAQIARRRPRGLARLKALGGALSKKASAGSGRPPSQKSPSLAVKILTAAATGAASVLANRLTRHLLSPPAREDKP